MPDNKTQGKADNSQPAAAKSENAVKNFQKKRPSRSKAKDEPIIPVKDVDDIDQYVRDESEKSVPVSRDTTYESNR